MGLEIERKFLVDAKKWATLKKPEGVPFKQGYLLSEPEKTIRIRVAGEKAWITIKGATLGVSRSEYEYGIPVKDAEEMLATMAGAVIAKKRYKIRFAGKLWEIDEFDGDNRGLLMAEIELSREAEEFEVPDWITTEVSGDGRYYNSSLAVYPFNQWNK
ncbi:MAG: CYTH domain-containing protein [Mucilaginibacter sp.]